MKHALDLAPNECAHIETVNGKVVVTVMQLFMPHELKRKRREARR
jgi:hypothetical protein